MRSILFFASFSVLSLFGNAHANGKLTNSAIIDFSRLGNIPSGEKAITIQVEVTDSSGSVLRTLDMTYTPGESTPDAAALLFSAGLQDLNWTITREGDFKVIVHYRNVTEKNVTYVRPITSIRFVGLVGGPDRVPRITTTGKVKVIVN